MHLDILKRTRPFGGGPMAVRLGRQAFTLLELMVVIVIIAALAALVVTNIGNTTDNAEKVAAHSTLKTVAEAFTGSAAGPGFLSDMRYVPGFRSVDVTIADLLTKKDTWQDFDPASQRGWRGPYLRYAAGANGTLAVTDPWGHPIVLQVPAASAFSGSVDDATRFRFARLVSAGANGVIDTDNDRLAERLDETDPAGRGDDLVLFLNRSDTYEPETP